jgi:hypothetical protein
LSVPREKRSGFVGLSKRTDHVGVVSPTHKRTKGRAPMWGSEFTSKDAALQGGSEKLLLGRT